MPIRWPRARPPVSTGNKFSISNIASQAIRAWLADHAGRFDAGHAGSATGAPAGGARGYQWKERFLPGGTELRMRYNGEAHHARVSGDAIMRRGRRVSPRQLTIAAAAAAMSEALRSALALVEHSNAQAVRKYERRVGHHRRAAAAMADHAMFA